MNFFLYILYSPSYKRTYVGQSYKLDERLIYHNSGKVRSTKPYRPWVPIYQETFFTRTEAMKREKWFKSKRGRKRISKIINDYLSNHPI